MSPDLHHLSGAYAVDALDDTERASFEQHLAVCADCRAEAVELSATAHSLSSLAEATPPPSLRASVLAGIAQVRPLPPLTAENEAEPDVGGTVVPIRRRRRTAWFAAAAAAAVIAVGGVAWSPWSDDAGAPSPMARVAAAADATTVRNTQGGVTTQVAYSKQLGKAAISVKGLPPAPDGKTYQVWYVGAGGTITSAGLFGVDADGSGQALLAGEATPTDKVAVSVEPAGGSAQPTTDPLVVIPLV